MNRHRLAFLLLSTFCFLNSCGGTSSTPDDQVGPGGLVAQFVPVEGFDGIFQLRIKRGEESELVDASWSNRWDLKVEWTDGPAGPVLWTENSDVGRQAFMVSFPEVQDVSCLNVGQFDELLLSENPELVSDAPCR